ncbi:unnamed protein product [Schistocephalus solidus]|uniref:Vps16_C domain-containing protein n=1 Tax=Schistocephalus solidus TaxID=70667 RepID=A0A183S8J1_SCHSO|nr:unnamed protein product [Schistocephalus solidus]
MNVILPSVLKLVLFLPSLNSFFEECWTKSLRTCVADLRSGGISSWPVEMFVSLDAKRKLLELASETFDGDFLLQVVLLVKSRLDREIFFQVLLENELSYQQYVRFLNETGQITDATALYETELSSNPNLRAMHASTLQAVDLLEFQTQVVCLAVHLFKQIPVVQNSEWLDFVQKTLPSASEHVKSLLGEISGPLIGQNLASTMVACILMDNKATNGSRAYQLKDKHKMPDEVFRWLALEPLIALQHWMEIDSLLMEKVIARYLQYLPDSDTLVDLVVRLGLYGLGIEVRQHIFLTLPFRISYAKRMLLA